MASEAIAFEVRAKSVAAINNMLDVIRIADSSVNSFMNGYWLVNNA